MAVWILQHFLCISGLTSIKTYTKDMPRSTTSSPLRRNQTTEPFIMYLDHLVSEDMHFNIYVDHRQTRPFDEIVLYFGWLACGSRLTTPHLPESVKRLLDYT
ncbi:hypothetical protein KIW84_012178 [Lathyrus oleraceus]|uniref:Uncharacterized protein n=1 Tax=Pisum sativum TaxID=3888 RepID=A0A9D5BH09_PEA|nr:hypothetical protein KIW84_012178 [Pisum sativum]